MTTRTSKRRNWSAENARRSQLAAESKTARNMGQSTSSLNASSAAVWPSGSAGVTLISVSPATRSSVVETMLVGRPRISCRSVPGPLNAHSRLSTRPMEKSILLDAVSARTL
jgi:hypothetical protein